MKRFIGVFAVLMLISPVAMAYQVTGPVVEVTDTKIVVDKDGEKHEMAVTKDTKGTGKIKKGDKVTVQFKMTATSIEVKTDKAPAKK
jgi:ribosome maturation factor RimP